jgi:peptidoglycan/LPS O-acetylase OafA/YrhL
LNRLEALLVRHCAVGLVFGAFLWLAWPRLEMAPWLDWLVRVLTRTPVAFFAVLAAIRSPLVSRVLSTRPLVSLGVFSYSLYLVHSPIIQAAHHFSGSDAWPTVWKLAFFEGPVLAVTLVAGYLFYLVAERPFMRRKPT